MSESHEREVLTGSAAEQARPTTKMDRVGEVDMNLYPVGLRPTCADATDQAHVERIRKRVRSGAYNTIELLDLLARRLLNSGDL
ncbi:MAG TPA: hypothetical protein VH277_08325 [Gemmatimonadaceae bacterium]|nr:hypothetical protein [Gemmatimonadaceae bacterium]